MGFALVKSIFKINTYLKEIKGQLLLIHRINSSQSHLKIVEEERAINSEDAVFTIQITGKNSFAKVCASELFEDKELLREFSTSDQGKIIKAVSLLKKTKIKTDKANPHDCFTKPQLYLFEQPNYKIAYKNYDRAKKEFTYTIKMTYKGETESETYSSKKLLKNTLVTNKLGFNDGYQIGHDDGVKHVWDSINQIKNLKRK